MAVIQPPTSVVDKFNKQQFKPGDAVCFTWFNTKRFGYVIKTSQSTWGIMYTIQLGERKYPCGIQIGEWKTKYETGLLQYDITKQYTEDQRKQLAGDSKSTMYETVTLSRTFRNDETDSTDAGDVGNHKDNILPKTASKRNNKNSRTNADSSNTKLQQNGSEESSTINVNAVSSVGVQQRNTKKRSKTTKTELDDAIQRQRDFLNGFVKKD